MNIKAIFTILSVFILAQILSACGSLLPSVPPTATVMPTPTIDPMQSAKIVQAFWDALEAGDVETAMAYLDDEAVCAGRCYFTGKAAFHYFLLGYLQASIGRRIGEDLHQRIFAVP